MRILLALAALLASLPASAASINIGQSQILPDNSSGESPYLNAQHTPVPQACRLLDLNFYVATPRGQMYLGVYANAGGKPGALLAATPIFTSVAGWNKRTLAAPPQLQAGAVWLAFHVSNGNQVMRWAALGQGSVSVNRAFAPLPANFPAQQFPYAFQWSYYGTCETPPSVPPNAAPGAPAIQFAKFGTMRFAWDYGSEPIDGFRLYVGAGSSGCPGGPHMAVPAAQRTATVTHLAWDVTQRAQITAVRGGSESGCSNVAAGKPN